jgi:DNA-binding MarR family transcriptional regulator
MDRTEDHILAALDRLASAAVGMTTVALAANGQVHDLTLPQWRALVVISASTGLRAGDVASRQRRGVIVVEADPTDRRATILRATPVGVAMRAAAMARRRELMAEALAAHPGRLPRDLGQGLDAIADALERYA